MISMVGRWPFGRSCLLKKQAKSAFCSLADHKACWLRAHQALLGGRGYEETVALEDAAPAEPACAECRRAVLGIEEPFVGAEGPVEPHGVVEARELQVLVKHQLAVRD